MLYRKARDRPSFHRSMWSSCPHDEQGNGGGVDGGGEAGGGGGSGGGLASAMSFSARRQDRSAMSCLVCTVRLVTHRASASCHQSHIDKSVSGTKPTKPLVKRSLKPTKPPAEVKPTKRSYNRSDYTTSQNTYQTCPKRPR
eukprot:3880932-Prymnesium_polylepis.1